VNERECDKCGKTVGYSDWSADDAYGLAFTEYLQLDEDDELNRCEFCVSEDDWNESVR
jgi:flavin-dependent dehydrogenase